MAISFPVTLDNFTNPLGTDNLGSSAVPHATQHSNLNDAVEALEAKVGVDNSTEPTSLDARLSVIEDLGLGQTGWKDLRSLVSGAPGGAAAPTMTNFGPAHTPQRQEQAFAVGDYVFLGPFHLDHDIKVGGKAYLHVHWSTSGTNIQPVRWEMTVHSAKGHNQANFVAPATYTVTQAAHGTAWRHMITEVSDGDALTMEEPDTLYLVILRRVTNGATENTDSVFGLMVDMHYESNRETTPLKVPPFY